MDTQEENAAGTSAQREYERRRAKNEAKIRDRWGSGRLGNIALALSSERQSTSAWISGATGEAVVGARLDALASDQIVVLHDRRVPRCRANINHIVVTRAGVWVIDAKRYQAKRPQLRIDGGLFRPRVEKLVVGGDRTKLVDGVLHQVELVSEVLGSAGRAVPVTGALCFIDADLPTLGGSFATCDVHVLRPKRLAKLVAATDGPIDVEDSAAAIAARFPPA
ncbi:nuclease-related domain-containing protein [Curtobacterium sp. MCSS17_005]|uniref:nuclease-related domain-containing protein n=1 Tax=Curtobacterium sp. MCSS17_005 TaxID=2175641 RepID=UPI000DAA4CFC|nr:nuclease-related domain-containing protein [Curtobacterium sp. MCSS17_005]WIB34417.1 nuclease-related domain-containing protein [Curtobacterium sp. MCSS17_005]